MKKNYFVIRSVRWTLVNFILASSPILFSLLISFFIKILDWRLILESSFMDGTILVIAVSLAGAQFLTFTYARDYEKLDSKINSYINMGFIIISLLSTLAFAIIKLKKPIEECTNKAINNNTIIIFSLSILIFSLIYTYYSQIIKIFYDRIYSNVQIPPLDDENDNDFFLKIKEEKRKINDQIKKPK